jgi:hypothetical protein
MHYADHDNHQNHKVSPIGSAAAPQVMLLPINSIIGFCDGLISFKLCPSILFRKTGPV